MSLRYKICWFGCVFFNALHSALSFYCLAVDKERKRKERGWWRQWFASVKISIFHPRGELLHMKENENAVLGEKSSWKLFQVLDFEVHFAQCKLSLFNLSRKLMACNLEQTFCIILTDWLITIYSRIIGSLMICINLVLENSLFERHSVITQAA